MRRFLLAATLVAALAAAAGSIAWATIPDGEGVIHACVERNGGDVRLIDPDLGQTCTRKEAATDWNRTGPAGPSGPAGQPGPPGPAGQPGPPGPGVKTISGLVWIDGTVSLGTGFTASKFADRDYIIDFPPGTWDSFPVLVVSPFGLPGAFPIAEIGSITSPGDGSATAHVLTSSTAGPWTPHDVAFWFIATAS
jgi:hypothetical protein